MVQGQVYTVRQLKARVGCNCHISSLGHPVLPEIPCLSKCCAVTKNQGFFGENVFSRKFITKMGILARYLVKFDIPPVPLSASASSAPTLILW